jgi:hypothetical protein
MIASILRIRVVIKARQGTVRNLNHTHRIGEFIWYWKGQQLRVHVSGVGLDGDVAQWIPVLRATGWGSVTNEYFLVLLYVILYYM